jgi:protein ImuB
LQPEEFIEQIEFENEIETLEPLLATLRQFVEQLAARLECLHLVIGELDLRLGLSAGVEHRERFKIPVPTGDVKILCRLLHTRLENVRTDAAISSFRLEARPAPPDANQLGLFVTTLVNPNQFAETLGRLSSLCGGERVGIPAAEATLRPDAFRMNKPVLTEEADLFADTPHAPENQLGLQLRRFRPPLAAKIDFHDERPAVFRSSSFGGTITDTRGPFKTSGEWWDQNAWSRAEWDVQTADGMLYRLVRTPDGDFVEGVYD